MSKKRRLRVALDTLFNVNEHVSEQKEGFNVEDEESFDGEKFIQMLQSKNAAKATRGLKLFCDVAPLQTNMKQSHNITKWYLTASPDCKEIVQYMNAHLYGFSLTCYAYKALATILRQTAGVLYSKRAAGVLFCQTFIKTKLQKLTGAVSLRNSDITTSVLDLLTLMVMHGIKVAGLLLDKLEFSRKSLSIMMSHGSVKGDGDAEQRVRRGVVRFVVSLLVVGNAQLIQKLLFIEGLLDVALLEISNDGSAFSIHLLLTTILDKVLKDNSIAYSSKKKLFFHKGLLASIAELFDWDGTMDIAIEKDADNDETDGDKSTIHRLAYDFLHLICCSTKIGVITPLTFTEFTKLPNHFLLLFMLDLKEKISSVPLAFTLVIDIFQLFPSLLLHYFNSTTLNFEPSSSLEWFSNCQLLHDIYDRQPLVPIALEHFVKDRKLFEENSMSQLIEVILCGIIPPVMHKATLTSIISHSEGKVQLQGMKIIASSLLKLHSTLEFLKNISREKKHELKAKLTNDLTNSLLSAYKKRIPTLNTLMSTWKLICQHNFNDQRETEMLQVLQLYQQSFLKSFDASTFDFCDLLVGLTQVSSLESGRKSILLILDILIPSISNYKWFALESTNDCPFAVIISFITKLMKASKDVVLIEKVIQLVVAVGFDNGLVKHGDRDAELHVWLYFLSKFAQHKQDSSSDGSSSESSDDLFHLFISICSSVANNTDSYASKLQALTEGKGGQNRSKDRSLKVWISELPLVDIEHSSDDTKITASAPLETHQDDTHDCRISTLLFAAYAELASIDSSNTKYSVTQLDRFLSAVSTSLFHRQVLFSDNPEQFASIFSSLWSKVPSFEELPLLSETFGDIRSYVERSSHADDVELMMDERQLPQPEHIRNDVYDEAILADPHHPATCVQISFIEDKFAYILYRAHRQVTCMDKCKGNSQKLFENWTDQLLSCYTSINIEPEHLINECDQAVECKAAESSKCVLMSRTAYIKLLHKLLDSKLLKCFFANKHPNLPQSEQFFNTFITNIISKLLSSKGSIPYFYKEKLKNELINKLLTSTDDDLSTNSIYSSFEHWVASLSQDDVLEILSKAMLKPRKPGSKIRFMAVACRCLNYLLEIGCRVYPLDVVSELYFVLTNPAFNQHYSTFLSLLSRMLTHNPSLALFAPNQLLSWCLDRLDDQHVIILLQIVISQNINFQKHMLRLCTDDETYKLDASSHANIKPYISICSTLLRHFHLSDSETPMLIELMVSCKKHLMSVLLTDDKQLSDDEVSLLVWLIKNNHLSSKKMKKIRKKLPSLLQCDSQLTQRCKVAQAYLATLDDGDAAERNRFSMRLTDSMMLLCCQIMDEESSGILEVAARNLLFLFQKWSDSGWDSIKELVQFEIWTRFVTTALKHKLNNASILAVLLQVAKMSGCKMNCSECDITPGRLHAMVTHHSMFLQIILSDDTQMKPAKDVLVQLLHEIILHCDKAALRSRDLVYLLAAYNASLSPCDQAIYQIMQIYEWKGVCVEKYKPFFWGKPAMAFYPSLQKKLQSLYDQPDATKVLDCLSEVRMSATLKDFPITRRLRTAEQTKDGSIVEFPRMERYDDDGNDDRYDPAFILTIFATFLAPDNRFNPIIILKSNIIPFLLRSLCSDCPNLRHLAAHSLLLCEGHFKATGLVMRDVLLAFLSLIKNSLLLSGDHTSVQKHPSVVTLYLANAAQFFVQKSNQLRKFSLLRLFNQPRVNMSVVPSFIRFAFSHSQLHEDERIWILEILRDGIDEMNDYRVAEASKVFRTLMSFHDSTISSTQCKKLVLQIIARSCEVHDAAVELQHRYSLLPWLQGVVLVDRDRSGPSPSPIAVSSVLLCFWSSVSHSQRMEGRQQVLKQLANLLVDLMRNFTLQSDQAMQTEPQPIADLLRVLNQVIDASKREGGHVALTFDESEAVRKAAARVASDAAMEEALTVIKHSRFDPSRKLEVEVVVDSLVWYLNAWADAYEQLADDVVEDVLTWIHTSLRCVSNERVDRLRSPLARCYDLVCASTRQSISNNCLQILHSMAQFLLHTNKDNDLHNIRTLLYRDVNVRE